MPPKKRKSKTTSNTKKSASPSEDVPDSKKAKFDFLDFTKNEVDPIIENLRDVSARYKRDMCLDEEILDQISLEGLTGLTVGYLCRLLDAINPNLNSVRDYKTQDFIWSIIVDRYARRISGAKVQVYYCDPSMKKNSQIICKEKTNGTYTSSQSSNNNNNNNITASSQQSHQDDEQRIKNYLIIDKEIKLPSHTLKRVAKSDWMLHPVQDGPIMGSCEHYLSRTNITDEILKQFDSLGARGSLHEANKKYNLDNVFLVADQELRRSMLLPPSFDPNMDIKLREYACLELIGRTRSLGIVFPNDKSLGRYRILLTDKKLITQHQQTCNSYIVHHIRRFSQYNLESSSKAFKSAITSGFMSNSYTNADDDLTNIQDDDDDRPTVKRSCCEPRRLKMDRDMLKMVYDVIALSKGRSMLDIRRKLKIPKSHARNHLKNLGNIGLIGSHTRVVDDKMTRIFRANNNWR